MKILYLLLAIMFFAVGCNRLSGQADKNAAINFNELEHDFGTLNYADSAVHEFVFTNTSKTPLVIESCNASCGCTLPSWTKEPVKTNKKGTVKVIYNTHIPGAFSKSITVYSNAETSPVTLHIKGVVKAKGSN